MNVLAAIGKVGLAMPENAYSSMCAYKESYISAKEPYTSAKEPYISATETNIRVSCYGRGRACKAAKPIAGLCVLKEPCVSAK